MEFMFDLLQERILTAIQSTEAPPKGGFTILSLENQKQKERVLKHLGIKKAEGSTLAALIETGFLGRIRFACLITTTHLYLTGSKDPVKLADIRDVDHRISGHHIYPTVTAGKCRYTFFCSELHARYLEQVLAEVHRVFLLTQNPKTVFDSVAHADTSAPRFTEKMPALTEFSLEPDWLFSLARRLILDNSNAVRGMELLLLSADLGYPDAQYALGLFFHLNGSPVQKDPETAAYWFAQAAAQGHEDAQNQLDLYYARSVQEKGAALWESRRRNAELLRLAQGDEAERRKAGDLCLERMTHCLVMGIAMFDYCIMPNEGTPLERAYRSLDALKESLAWLEYAQKLGHPDVEENRQAFLHDSRSTIVNEIIPGLREADRTQDAFDCQIWLAELGDGYTQALLGRHYLQQQEPIQGIRWLEQAISSGSSHAPMFCIAEGVAYVKGQYLPAGAPPYLKRKARAIGIYLLERSGNTDELSQYQPHDPEALRSLALELRMLENDFPRAAKLADKYRAMADQTEENLT